MSSLLARVMLTIFMVPAAAVLYVMVLVILIDGDWFDNLLTYPSNRVAAWLTAGIITWGFVALYWIALWRKTIRWTPRRRGLTLTAAAAGLLIGVIAAVTLRLVLRIDGDFSLWVGTVIPPLLWLIATTLLWKETPAERADRLAGGQAGVACPTCGYNLTGLKGTRCPECGSEFTVDELLAARQEQSGVDLR